MSSFYPPKLVPRPTAPVVGADARCHKCRSALAGLKSTDKCPNCGINVGVSLRGPEMRYSDPAWIGRLKLGADVAFLSTLLLALGVAVIKIVSRSPDNPAVDPRISSGVTLLGGLGGILAIWLLTTPDPSGIGEKSYGTARRLARWMPITILGALACLVLETIVHIPAIEYWEEALAANLFGIANLVGFIALLQYLSKLALRMRDARLSERCGALRLGWSLAGALLLAVGVFSNFVMPTDFARDNDLGSLLLALLAVASLSAAAMLAVWILTLLRLSASLSEQRRLAIPLWQE